jgi:ComF family protein
MSRCLICHNKSEKQIICQGCKSLVTHAKFSCETCGVKLSSQQKQCGHCQTSPPIFTRTYSAVEYKEPVDAWVKSLKFGKNLAMSRLFAEIMQEKAKNIEGKYVFMPVPLHKSRLRLRGYNQAYEIAKELTKLTGRKLDNSLKRQKKTQMQAQLKFKQRAKNVKNAFGLKGELKHKKIVLIDDVMTSGNTLRECAKVLKKAGAKDINVLVFARKS